MARVKPNVLNSSPFWQWVRNVLSLSCQDCIDLHGRIFEWADAEQKQPPLHPNCRCRAKMLQSVLAGTATNKGISGADWYLKYFNKLPENYITREEAEMLGWKKKEGNLVQVAPGKLIGGNVYENKRKILPLKEGRKWFEADINYEKGYRNDERVLYSNDGLVFVTFDHYKTFYFVR